MKISYDWLKDYINPVPAPQAVAEILTGGGLEVEGMETYQSVKGGLEGVCIGEVRTCEKHPNSDHLSVTQVDVGKEELLHIVCGAPNVAAGQKVAVALIGTTLYFGDKEVTLQKTKIRGEVSEGMICAEDELGLGTSHAGIMVLDPSAQVGTPAKEYFQVKEDHILEIGLTPNRVDAASHIGVARDLAALLVTNPQTSELGTKLMLPDVSSFSAKKNSRKIDVLIEDPEACPRYSGLTLTGITVSESPKWLKERLASIGLRPINNIVDITNFILHEMGQPLHAFDADKIKGDKVIIRKLEKGKKFVTLDEVERELTEHDLMICNTEEPMCIAGVFGGVESGVTEQTTNVFLESACFDPRSIRRTSRHHGLQTDASFRFERGADIEITVFALKRAALLITGIAGGTVASEIVDAYPVPRKRSTVVLSYAHLDRLIGKSIERETVKKILHSLGIQIIQETPEELKLEIPAFKVDVLREADVIEEVLRIYGYNNVETNDTIRGTLALVRDPDPEKIQNMISEFLNDNGFHEIMNNSLTRSSYYEGNSEYPVGNCVKILNPLSRDLDVLRQTLLYGGLESISYNRNRKCPDVKFFEFGNCYSLNPAGGKGNAGNPLEMYREKKHMVLFLSGRQKRESWNTADDPLTLYDLKNYLNMALLKAGLDLNALDIREYSSPMIKEGLAYHLKDAELVRFGILSGSLIRQFDCQQDVLYADLDWEVLLGQLRDRRFEISEIPRFPEVRRDLALLLDSKITFSEIEKLSFQTEKNILKKVGLFDVYEGEKIEAGKKSYALYFILQDDRKTLTDKDIEKVMSRLVKCFQEKLQAKLR